MFRLTFWPRFYNSGNYIRNQTLGEASRAMQHVFVHTISMHVLLAWSFDQIANFGAAKFRGGLKSMETY